MNKIGVFRPENGGNAMMPLSLAQVGEENIIKRIGGSRR